MGPQEIFVGPVTRTSESRPPGEAPSRRPSPWNAMESRTTRLSQGAAARRSPRQGRECSHSHCVVSPHPDVILGSIRSPRSWESRDGRERLTSATSDRSIYYPRRALIGVAPRPYRSRRSSPRARERRDAWATRDEHTNGWKVLAKHDDHIVASDAGQQRHLASRDNRDSRDSRGTVVHRW